MSARVASAVAAASAMSASALAAEPLAVVDGAPDGPVADVVRAAVGEAEAPAATAFEARRRAERARDRALTALRSEGYYAARARAEVEQGEPPRAHVVVEPGARFVIGAVRLETEGFADTSAQEAAARALDLASGAPARATDVIAAEERARAAIVNAGYPDAAARDRLVTVDHARNAVDVTIRVAEGRAAILGPMRLTGSARLRPAYVERLAPFKPGDRFAPQALDTLVARLSSTGAFAAVSARLAEPDLDGPDHADPDAPPTAPVTRAVIVEARQGPRRTLALGAAYSTSEGVGVEAEWARRNLFGGAEELTVSAAARTIDRHLGVALAIPHWRRPGRTLRLETAAADEATDAFDRQALDLGARIEAPVRPRVSASLGAGVELSRIDDGTTTQDFGLIHLSSAIAWDGSDDVLDPKHGARAALSARPTAGVGDGAVGYAAADATASFYRPLGEHVTGALRGRLGAIFGPPLADLPADERLFAGGGGSVRGYAYQALSPRDADGDLIGGRSVIETSAELRVRGDGRWGYAAFIDGGTAGRAVEPAFDAMRWGAGAGVRYYAPFGPIRADIAAPLDPQDGDPPLQIYVSIGQAF